MLKYRLVSGTIMTMLFAAVTIIDWRLDGSVSAFIGIKNIKATGLCLLMAIVVYLSQQELVKMAAKNGLKILLLVTMPASILLSATWYLHQFIKDWPISVCILTVLAFTIFSLLWVHYLMYGVTGLLANCGASLFSVVYLGILISFVLAVRIEFGVWQTLMFIFVVKAADIGAYTSGTLFGRHKFSPKISPGKTWEGMAGAIIAAILVSIFFSEFFDIMSGYLAVIFGFCFAFIGQLGDLAESMIKRDAQQKDASNSLPGFGGILDVIDSPLAAAVFAYLFFWVIK